MDTTDRPTSLKLTDKITEGDTKENNSSTSTPLSDDILTRLGETVELPQHDKLSEDVTTTKSKKKKKTKLPNIRIFYGTFVHCTSKGSFTILDKWLLGVKNGKIVFSDPVQRYGEILEERNLKPFAKDITISLGEGTFMMPGFVDVHTDAVSLLALGIQGGNKADNTFSQSQSRKKLSLVHDDRIANELFAKVIERTINCGSTTVAYDGTHIESAVRLLANALAHHKQRGYVSVDVCVPDQREHDHMIQMTKVEDFIQHAQKQLIPGVGIQLMLSALLPDWLENRVAKIHHDMDVTVKVSLSASQNGGMAQLEGQTPLQYHTKHDLIDDKTQVLHWPDCDLHDLTQFRQAGCGIIYCPAQDIKCGTFTDLRQLVGSEVKLGLGSDLKNSGSLSMLEAIRQCVHVSKQPIPIKSTGTVEGQSCEDIQMVPEEVDYQDFFYMATLGGAEVLGLSDQVGNFEVGKEFDALLVDPHVPSSPFFTLVHKDTPQDIVERFLFCGDDRNITAVYISGQRVK